jgi:uncharacterized membrane protein HdeD (DUF308 family)
LLEEHLMSYPPTSLVRTDAQRRQRSVLGQVYAWMTAGLHVISAVTVYVTRAPLVLLASIAAWSMTTRVFERTTAVRLRTAIDNDRLLLVSSVISVIYGVLLRIVLDVGALALVWLSGAYALLVGTLTLALAVRLPGLHWAMGNPAPGGVSAPTSSPIEVCYAAPLPTLCHP